MGPHLSQTSLSNSRHTVAQELSANHVEAANQNKSIRIHGSHFVISNAHIGLPHKVLRLLKSLNTLLLLRDNNKLKIALLNRHSAPVLL